MGQWSEFDLGVSLAILSPRMMSAYILLIKAARAVLCVHAGIKAEPESSRSTLDKGRKSDAFRCPAWYAVKSLRGEGFSFA